MSKWRNESALLVRYLGSGVLNTLVGFGVIFLLMACGVSPVVSNISGYFVGFLLGFIVSKKFVFRSNGHFVKENIRYLFAFLISFLFNLLVLRLALIYSDLPVVASQILAAVGYTMLMYLLGRFFVFSSKKNENPLFKALNRLGLAIYCSGIIGWLLFWVVDSVGLGPLDDHHFIRTIFQGKNFGFYVFPELGRFFPFTAQEYVILAKLFWPSAQIFYLFNASKLLLCGGLLFFCLTLIGLGNFAAAILWTGAIFSMGIANTLFRLSAGEFNMLILMLLFAICILMLQPGKSEEIKYRKAFAIFGISVFSLALFYKELTFVFGLIFAISEIIRAYCVEKSKPSFYIVATLLVSVAYIVLYGIWRYLYVTGSYADLHTISLLDVLSLYARNDPIIIFIILPVTAYRFAVILLKPERYTIYDSFLLSASGYACAFMLLAMFNTYYLLPTYAFSICGLAGVLVQSFSLIPQRLILAFVLIFSINIFPLAIADINRQKLIAINHYKFVTFLSKWLKKNENAVKLPRNIVLVGVTSGSGIEILTSLKIFLTSLGTPESLFMIKASERTDNKNISDFYGYNEENGYTPKVNDLIIFNPYQSAVVHKPVQSPSSREIYHSELEWALPRWTALNWIELCFLHSEECETRKFNGLQYAGYAALLKIRDSESISEIVPLQTPVYQLDNLNIPNRMRIGSSRILNVQIKNTGTETWPAVGTLLAGMYVNLSYRWFDLNKQIVLEGNRVPFPEPIRPNDVTNVSMILKTPKQPGNYKLVIGPVQEGVCWFPDSEQREIEVFE